jgi:hypothetical protein
MLLLECIGLALAAALSVSLFGEKYRERRARQLAIKYGRTLTVKYALPPRRWDPMS